VRFLKKLKKNVSPIGQDLIGFFWAGWKTKDFLKSTENAWEKFFLEHVSRHFRCSICGKKFNRIGCTIIEIWKSTKRGGLRLIEKI
jgi:hypothetical protein